MKIYQLTDRDFEEFYLLMEKIEFQSRAKDGDGPLVEMKRPLNDLRRTYRYHFLAWRNQMTNGDSYVRGIEPPREDIANHVKWEIERLKKLLPKSDE